MQKPASHKQISNNKKTTKKLESRGSTWGFNLQRCSADAPEACSSCQWMAINVTVEQDNPSLPPFMSLVTIPGLGTRGGTAPCSRSTWAAACAAPASVPSLFGLSGVLSCRCQMRFLLSGHHSALGRWWLERVKHSGTFWDGGKCACPAAEIAAV